MSSTPPNTLRGSAAKGRHVIELLGVARLSARVRLMRWRRVEGPAFPYLPGQAITLTVETGGRTLCRSFSLASAPNHEQPDHLEIAVGVGEQGSGSETLASLPLGTRAEVDGPHGSFVWNPERSTVLLIGAGTGVSPLRAMLDYELRVLRSQRSLHLLVGFREEADALWRADFSDWAREHERFTFAITLSRGSKDWRGLRGYVQDHLKTFAMQARRPDVYVCGRGNMVGAVRDLLAWELDYDPRSIRTECFG